MNTTRILLAAAVGVVLGWAAAALLGGSNGEHDSAAAGGDGEREVLYWVAPMDPNYRSDEPGKSPMGMDLVPVYADDQLPDSGEPALRIAPAVVNNIGVKTAGVARGTLHRHIDTVGYVTPDADRVSHVHVRAEGWIEQLEADTEGDAVSRDAALFEIYSPALASAQDEYLQALRAGGSKLIEASERRLAALGMNAGQIRALRASGRARKNLTVTSPQDGYLLELNVREGMFVEPGNTIMSLADLSEIWVDVDVFEQQIDWVQMGQTARMRLPFAPDRVWQGTVDYVYPTIRPETRSARVRLAFDNPDLVLKPNMYANVEIEADPRRDVLHVPAQAVIRSGDTSRVILALGDGRFRPAEVATGLESEGRIEILRGLSAGERVVVSSQFLIDSEASLDASLLRMIDAPGGDHDDHGSMHHEHGAMAEDAP
jgi:Cu(I)/Ag(I) efflux system membrane fusion protein